MYSYTFSLNCCNGQREKHEAFLYSFDVEMFAIESRLAAVVLDEDVAPVFTPSAAEEVELDFYLDNFDTELDELLAKIKVDLVAPTFTTSATSDADAPALLLSNAMP